MSAPNKLAATTTTSNQGRVGQASRLPFKIRVERASRSPTWNLRNPNVGRDARLTL